MGHSIPIERSRNVGKTAPVGFTIRKRIFDLEGEAQINADGRNRQVELLRCVPGEPVVLQRQLDGCDQDKVTVLSARGVPIGELSSQYAQLLAPLLDAKRAYRAKLHCLRGGLPRYPRYGARISIVWDGSREHPHLQLDEQQIRYRQRKVRASESWRAGAAAKIRKMADSVADAISG